MCTFFGLGLNPTVLSCCLGDLLAPHDTSHAPGKWTVLIRKSTSHRLQCQNGFCWAGTEQSCYGYLLLHRLCLAITSTSTCPQPHLHKKVWWMLACSCTQLVLTSISSALLADPDERPTKTKFKIIAAKVAIIFLLVSSILFLHFVLAVINFILILRSIFRARNSKKIEYHSLSGDDVWVEPLKF